MRKKGIPEVLVRPVMSLLSLEFDVKAGMNQWSLLSPCFLSVVVDVVNEVTRVCVK